MYKKLVLVFMLCVSILGAKELSQKEVANIAKLPMLFDNGIFIEKAYEINDIYILETLIQNNEQTFFLTKDKKNLIAGKVYDMNKKTEIVIPKDISFLKGNQGLTYGTGSDEYYLFTDPECPYCKKFESYFPKLEKNVKINVFFYPLSFHKNAKELSYYILSHKTDALKAKAMFKAEKSLEDFKNKKYSKDEKEKYVKMVEKHMDFAKKLKVSGTPSLFDKNGKQVVWTSLLNKYGIQQ